jgi:hypothetical protein
MSIQASEAERYAQMPGDGWIAAARGRARIVMTRAVTIDAPPEDVWPWLAQLGRGAGWYSYDAIDNGRRRSASHLVSWIPPPRLGDATAIGYLRHLTPGVCLAWWTPGERWLGSSVRMAATYQVSPQGTGSRLVQRIAADGSGWSRHAVRALFAPVDLLMSRRQLLGIRERVYGSGAQREDPRPESGRRDQYQLYECVYADGNGCGVPGEEAAGRWHEVAIAELGGRIGAERS